MSLKAGETLRLTGKLCSQRDSAASWRFRSWIWAVRSGNMLSIFLWCGSYWSLWRRRWWGRTWLLLAPSELNNTATLWGATLRNRDIFSARWKQSPPSSFMSFQSWVGDQTFGCLLSLHSSASSLCKILQGQTGASLGNSGADVTSALYQHSKKFWV